MHNIFGSIKQIFELVIEDKSTMNVTWNSYYTVHLVWVRGTLNEMTSSDQWQSPGDSLVGPCYTGMSVSLVTRMLSVMFYLCITK